VEEIQELGENLDRKVNRDFRVRGAELYDIATRERKKDEIENRDFKGQGDELHDIVTPKITIRRKVN
jgi:hypothetical protein